MLKRRNRRRFGALSAADPWARTGVRNRTAPVRPNPAVRVVQGRGAGRANPEQLVDRLSKPQPHGGTRLRPTPLELIARLAALILPPRPHRHRHDGVPGPNSPRRAQTRAHSGVRPIDLRRRPQPRPAPRRATARRAWALLLARIYARFPLFCPSAAARCATSPSSSTR